MITELTDQAGIARWATLENFVHFFDPDDLTASITALLGNWENFRKSRDPERPNFSFIRKSGHLRQAFKAAKAVVDVLLETPHDADVDLDAPLPSGTHDDMSAKWKDRYHFQIRPEFTPDEPTLTRY